MKKKGLIISTVVMVVVLIASLTTATYAWFSTTAQATIEDLQVMTQASKGLQIAVYTPDTAQASAYTNGASTYSENWKGQNSGFGSAISFTTPATYMGVSGDGNKMYSLNDPATALAAENLDSAVMKTAKANGTDGEYFMAYIALRNTESKAQKILLDSIVVTAKESATNAMSKGMAASLRIALFVDDTTGTSGSTPAATVFDEKEANLVYLPFNQFKFTEVGATWEDGTAASLTYLEENVSFTSEETTKSQMKETTLTVDETKVKGDGVTCSAAAPDKSEKTSMAHQVSASVAANGVVYLKLVVWFEGQDPECISLFSGGGASINMVFVGQDAAA